MLAQAFVQKYPYTYSTFKLLKLLLLLLQPWLLLKLLNNNNNIKVFADFLFRYHQICPFTKLNLECDMAQREIAREK